MAYDDFEDGTLDAWTEEGTGGATIAVVEAAKKFGVYGCRFSMAAGSSGNWKRIKVISQNEATGNYFAYVRMVDASQRLISYAGYDAGSKIVFNFKMDDDRIYYGTVPTAFTEVPSDNTWYRLRATRTAVDKVDYRLYDASDSILETHTDIATEGGAGNIQRINIQSEDVSDAATTIDWDNVCHSDTSEPSPPPAGGAELNMKGYW